MDDSIGIDLVQGSADGYRIGQVTLKAIPESQVPVTG
jgi:hypothetical protein